MTPRFSAVATHAPVPRGTLDRRGHPALIALLGGFVALAGIAEAPSIRAQPVPELPLQFLSTSIPMTIAGQAAELRVVRTDATPQDAIDAVAAVWQRESGLIRRNDDGPWVNLSRIDRGGLQALQLRASGAGGSEGYLVDWRLAASAPVPDARGRSAPGSNAPGSSVSASPPTGAQSGHATRLLPVGARLISEVASNDPPRGRTLVAWVDAELAQADRQTAARAQAAGLSPVRAPGRLPQEPGSELSRQFSGPGFDYAITLHAQGRGTALVVHQMEAVR